MAYSADFCKTVALIAARAQIRWQYLAPELAVEFAWFSVNCDGDAAEDDDNLVSHFRDWLEAKGFDIPDWMI